jgi:hypothetical protein
MRILASANGCSIFFSFQGNQNLTLSTCCFAIYIPNKPVIRSLLLFGQRLCIVQVLLLRIYYQTNLHIFYKLKSIRKWCNAQLNQLPFIGLYMVTYNASWFASVLLT